MTETPAGWYNDPADPSLVRWWDGTAWTQHAQPRQEVTPGPHVGNPARAALTGADTQGAGADSTSDRRGVRAEAKAAKAAEELARRNAKAISAAEQRTLKDERASAKVEEREQDEAAKQSKEVERRAAKDAKNAERRVEKDARGAAQQALKGAKSAEVAAVRDAAQMIEQTFASSEDVAEPDVVPPQHAPLIEAGDHLRKAATHAEAGDIASEERSIRLALDAARRFGLVKGPKLLKERMKALQAAGFIRRGVSELGTVKAEGFFSQWGRKQSMGAVQTGDGTVTVFNDRVVAATAAYEIDHLTQAQVYLDGQSLVTQRPTLTRMALLSPLPGSALIPGLALQKKERDDRRQGQFVVGSTDWSHSTLIAPDSVPKARGIAEQINRIAESKSAQLQVEQASNHSVAALQRDDVITRLERIRSLHEAGTIDGDEAKALKAAVLAEG